MKNIQDLLVHIRTAINNIYELPEADAIARQVAEHILKLSRLQLSVERQSTVSDNAWGAAEKIIQRLQQHEPLQYVLGYAHFYGLELEVNSSVLIPRPETEELVDLIVRQHAHQENLQILDICTGSGCISIALSAHLLSPKVYGLDISSSALAVAQSNALKYNQPVSWLKQDILNQDIALAPASLDIIVSNPPYVLEQEKALMQPNVLAFEPHLALFVPDTNALLFYKRIAEISLNLLKATGTLYFEINEKQANQLSRFLKETGYQSVEIWQDLFGKERFIKANL